MKVFNFALELILMPKRLVAIPSVLLMIYRKNSEKINSLQRISKGLWSKKVFNTYEYTEIQKAYEL